MPNIKTLKMFDDGELCCDVIPLSRWLNSIEISPRGHVTYEATIPDNISWPLYYALEVAGCAFGYTMDEDRESVVLSMIEHPKVSALMTGEDDDDPEDWLMKNSLISGLVSGDKYLKMSKHGWIGIKPVEKEMQLILEHEAPYYFKIESVTDAIYLFDVAKSDIQKLTVGAFEMVLNHIGEEFELVHTVKPPSLHIALTPIFEVIGEVNLTKKIKGMTKESKVQHLKDTVANLGLQPRGKAVGDMVEIIQETLHEIAEHYEMGDVLVAHTRKSGLGPLVLQRDVRDAFDWKQQVGILARESGGVVLPTTPILSSVKDMILIKPI